jgi:hypothetical protein
MAARIEMYLLIIGSYGLFSATSACSMVLYSSVEIENTQLSEQTAQRKWSVQSLILHKRNISNEKQPLNRF